MPKKQDEEEEGGLSSSESDQGLSSSDSDSDQGLSGSDNDNDNDDNGNDEKEKEQKDQEKKKKKKRTQALFKAVSMGTRFNIAPRSFSVTKEYKTQNPIRSGKFVLSNMKLRNFPLEEMKKCELDKFREFDPKRPPMGQKFPLRFLDISMNQISSNISHLILPFPQLEDLNLMCNFLGLDEVKEGEVSEFNDQDGFVVCEEISKMKRSPVVDLSQTLSQLKALANLDLSNNFLEHWPNISTISSQIKKINFARNGLKELPISYTFNQLNNLNLSRNCLTSLPPLLLNFLPSITSLDLSENFISVLPDLGFSSTIRVFSLKENKLKSLPSNFFSFFGDKLKDLSLQFNELTFLPEIEKNFPSLEVLNLSQNQLAKIPNVTNISKLEVLNIENNNIEEIPDTIGSLVNLSRFLASYNKIHAIPSSISNLKELTWLDLSHNKLMSLPKELGLLDDKLYLLSLRNNSLSDDSLEPIWSMKGLSELDLSENNITRISENIGNLTQLFVLKLSGNQLTENTLPSLTGIGSFGNEEVYQSSRSCLYLNDNCFTHFPTSLYDLKALQVLSIDSNAINSVPSSLEKMGNLKVLSISIGSVKEYPQIDQLTLPKNLERLYFQIHPDEAIAQKFMSLFPSFMIDTDLITSEKCPQLFRKTRSLVPGPTKRKMVFSQMMGVGVHPLEDSISFHSWNTQFGLVEFYAVFDGHGGLQTSSYLQDNLYKEIQMEIEKAGPSCLFNIKELIVKAFKEVNLKLKEMFKAPGGKVEGDGATAVVVLIIGDKLYCANCGDSRGAIIKRQGEHYSSKYISVDHKPKDREEEKRIRKAGGYINTSTMELNNYRLFFPGVSNGIAVCRSFGDFPLSPAMTEIPRVEEHHLTAEDKIMILACDGIWDVMDAEKVTQIIMKGYQKDYSLEWMAMQIRGTAFALGSGDDMSVLLVQL